MRRIALSQAIPTRYAGHRHLQLLSELGSPSTKNLSPSQSPNPICSRPLVSTGRRYVAYVAAPPGGILAGVHAASQGGIAKGSARDGDRDGRFRGVVNAQSNQHIGDYARDAQETGLEDQVDALRIFELQLSNEEICEAARVFPQVPHPLDRVLYERFLYTTLEMAEPLGATATRFRLAVFKSERVKLECAMKLLADIAYEMMRCKFVPHASLWTRSMVIHPNAAYFGHIAKLVALIPHFFRDSIPPEILSAVSIMFAQLSAPLPNKHNSVIRNLLRLLLLRDQPPSALPLSFAILDSIPKPHSPSYLSYPLLSCATLGDTTTGLQLLDSQPPNNSSTRNLYSNFLHALYKRGHFSAIPDVWRAMVDRRVSPNLETCRTLLSWAADGVAASGISAHKAGLTVDRAWAIGVWETALEVSQELEQDENKGQRESPESHNKQNKLLRLPHTTPDKGIDLETQLTDLDEYTDLSSPLESSRWPLPLARDLLAHCYGHLVRLLLRLDHTAETHDWVNRVLVYHRRYPNRGVIPTPYLASIVVADAMRRSDAVGAMRWLDKFKEAGVQLNVHSVSALVKAFCEADDPEGGERTIMESRARWGVHPTGECISPLITYYAMRRDGEAVRRMETLVTTLAIPASPSLYGHKLVTLMSKGEDAAAIEEIKAMRASRVEPDADLLVSLARVGPARKGDIDKARRLVPLSRPQDALAVELEAWAARAKLGADRSEVWRRINVVLEEAKRRELKIPLYGRQAVVEAIGGSDEVVGDNGMLLAECMSHHILNRKPRAALSAFDSFTLRNPTAEVPPQAWSWRLRAYHLLDQPVQLRRTWQQMVQENKTSAKSWRTWGLFNAMEGSRRGALEAENALSVLKTDSNLANAQYSPFDDIRFHQRLNVAQAVAYHNLGDLPSATSHIEQSVHFASQSENRVLGAELNRVLLAIAEATYNKRQLSGGLELWLRTFRILKRWDLVTEIMSMIEKRPDGMVRRRYLVTRTMLMIRKRPKGKVKESNNN